MKVFYSLKNISTDFETGTTVYVCWPECNEYIDSNEEIRSKIALHFLNEKIQASKQSIFFSEKMEIEIHI